MGFGSGGVGVNEGRRQLRDGVGQGVFGFVGDAVGIGQGGGGVDVSSASASSPMSDLHAADLSNAGFGGQAGLGGVDESGVHPSVRRRNTSRTAVRRTASMATVISRPMMGSATARI